MNHQRNAAQTGREPEQPRRRAVTDAAGPRRGGVPVREEAKAAPTELSRRAAMKLMAAATLLAGGTAGCRRKPSRKIVSMVDPPEYQKAGIPVYYASMWTMGQVPYGLMIKTRDGRPIKIEGLADHPLNRGAADAAMQASILSLYDPDRLRQPLKQGEPTTWGQVDAELVESLREAERVVLVTRSTLGPSERELIERWQQAELPLQHFVHETVHEGPRREVAQAVFGQAGTLRPRLDQAKVILSLDADFLGSDGQVLKTTRQYAEGRRLADPEREVADLSRLYVIESAMTVTGSNADHRVPLRPSLIAGLVPALRAAVAGDEAQLVAFCRAQAIDRKVLETLAQDLSAHRGQAVVLAGAHLPAATQASVALLNADLGAWNETLFWEPDGEAARSDSADAILAAVEAEGGADVVLLLDVNLAYDWPAEDFQRLAAAAKCLVGMARYEDETLAACTYALPDCHNLEAWNDAVPVPGVTGLCQPVIAPLFDTRQSAESLLLWLRALRPDDRQLADCDDWHAYLQRRWLADVVTAPGDWDDALRRGWAGEPAPGAETPVPFKRQAAEQLSAAELPAARDGLELLIRPHHALLDGRFAANAWLQELPDPVSKLVWENAAAVGPATARRLGVAENDRLAIGPADDGVTLPVLIQPGLAEDVVVVTLGHGRRRGASVGDGCGVNVAPLMGRCGAAVTPWLALGVGVQRVAAEPVERAARLVRTQRTFSMMDRPIVLQGTAAEYAHDPDFVQHRKHVPPLDQLDEPFDFSQGSKWVMAIDQSACTGCSACMIACQAENNVPVVGKQECGFGREMHWLRIDRYEDDAEDNPSVQQQPMLCQHCDNAPCESVCPVNATAHTEDGLNQQTYNRCVGTRYCANNCPYKVRRYNFFNYVGRNLKDSVQELAFNPQVTVRSRGVMEKCTFCVQRINDARFQAANAGESIPDGALRTACQQTCPANAIYFGDLNDPDSAVARMHASSLVYFVLEQLNVRPNVAYLARVTNPHPDLAGQPEEKHS